MFPAQVLHAENRTNDLFIWLKSLNWLYIRQLPDALKLVAQSHPNECTFQPLKSQLAIFAQRLYNTYSRLSALREELKLKGLARGK